MAGHLPLLVRGQATAGFTKSHTIWLEKHGWSDLPAQSKALAYLKK